MRRADAKVPDFFIVGHHKSGTTALYEMLRRHPQIFMPDLKEPRYLASDLRVDAGTVDDSPYPTTLEAYLALFEPAGAEQIIGEASATYLYSRTAAAQIAALQPQARIIAILREPVSFLRSLHLTYLKIHFEDERDLQKAMSLQTARSEGRHIPRSNVRAYAASRNSHAPQLLQYSEHVRYVEQLRRYYERFPADQLLVLIYDDYRNDNEGTLRTVRRFLNVSQQPSETVQANVTESTISSARAGDLLDTLSFGRNRLSRPAKAVVKGLTTQRFRSHAVRAIRRHAVLSELPPPDERFMLELRRRFQPEVHALSELLGRDLVALWGYDKLESH